MACSTHDCIGNYLAQHSRAPYITNAGKARSRGFDSTAQFRFVKGLTGDLSVAYTDARYMPTSMGPINRLTNTILIVVNKGDQLPVPAWTLALSLEERVHIWNDHTAYVRGDYEFTGSFHRTPSYGTAGYAPDVYVAQTTKITNVRAGVDLGIVQQPTFTKWYRNLE